jgi:hypothetical protein
MSTEFGLGIGFVTVVMLFFMYINMPDKGEIIKHCGGTVVAVENTEEVTVLYHLNTSDQLVKVENTEKVILLHILNTSGGGDGTNMDHVCICYTKDASVKKGDRYHCSDEDVKFGF